MFFKQLAAREASLSYFFGCAGHGVAVAVDVVAGDEDWFIEETRKAGVEIRYVIDTHVHADHYSGGRALAQRVGAPYCLHESDQGLVGYAARRSAPGAGQRQDRCPAYPRTHTGQYLSAGH